MSKLLMISKHFKTYEELHKYLVENNLLDHTKRYVIKITGNSELLHLEYREVGLFRAFSEGISKIKSRMATFTRAKGGLRHAKTDPMLRPLMKTQVVNAPVYRNKEFLGALTRSVNSSGRTAISNKRLLASDL